MRWYDRAGVCRAGTLLLVAVCCDRCGSLWPRDRMRLGVVRNGMARPDVARCHPPEWSGVVWSGPMWFRTVGSSRSGPILQFMPPARYNFLIPYPSALCSMAVRCCPSSFCSGPILQFMPPARHNFSIPCQPAWCSATVCFPSLYPVPAQHCNSMLPVPVCPCPGLSPVRSGGRWSGIIFRSRLSFSREG